MPAIGSVGDVIALVLLIKDLVKTLNDCRGSAYHFQQLVQQLQNLELALLEVDQLLKKNEGSPHLSALHSAVEQAATSCRDAASPFYGRVKGYERSLRAGGSGNVLKDAARKVQFRVLEKKEVDEFYGLV